MKTFLLEFKEIAQKTRKAFSNKLIEFGSYLNMMKERILKVIKYFH